MDQTDINHITSHHTTSLRQETKLPKLLLLLLLLLLLCLALFSTRSAAALLGPPPTTTLTRLPFDAPFPPCQPIKSAPALALHLLFFLLLSITTHLLPTASW